jgi:hypothetical protein
LILKQRNSFIFKIRKDLDENLYEGLLQETTVFLNVVSMSEAGRISISKNYIDTLKKKDEAKRIIEEKLKESKKI